MSTVRTVKKILSNKKFLRQEDSQKLSDFLKEMQKEGFIIKKEYDLPPLDTIGREIYQANKDIIL